MIPRNIYFRIFVFSLFLVFFGTQICLATTEKEYRLIHAANEGHTTTVQLLLDAGANPNAANRYGWTPLMLTTNPDIKALLRQYGAKSK